MDQQRLAVVAAALAEAAGLPVLDRLLAACVEMLDLSGASIAIIGGGEHLGAVAGTGANTALVDELQFSLGEGPCLDATTASGPMLEPDLRAATSQWPAFAPAAMALGVYAAFAFPLSVGAVRMGALTMYRDVPEPLAPEDLRDALALARVATHLLLDLQAHLVPGELPDRLAGVDHHRREVHQATGMIAVQLEGDVATALSRLRAFAWASDQSIDEVAAQVVARELRFEPE